MNKFLRGGRGLSYEQGVKHLSNHPTKEKSTSDKPTQGIRRKQSERISRIAYTLPMIIFCVLFSNAFAQSDGERTAVKAQQSIKPLQVGDTIPDELWTKDFLFYENGETIIRPLSSYRGKCVIIDFWATSCKGCVNSLVDIIDQPEIESAEVLLLATSYENNSRIKNFINRRPEMQKFNYIVEDNVLKEYFPYRFISHVVWIDQLGEIIAITGSTAMTAANVHKFAMGDLQHLPLKDDFAVFRDESIFNFSPLPLEGIVWLSGVKGYQGGLSPALWEETDTTLLISWRNRSILQLYTNYVHLKYPYHISNVIWNVPDISTYTWNCHKAQSQSLEEWNRDYSKSYEVHATKHSELWSPIEYILQDLNKLLKLNVQVDTNKLWTIVTLANNYRESTLKENAGYKVKIADLCSHLYKIGLSSLIWHGRPDDIIILDYPLIKLETKEQLSSILMNNNITYKTVVDNVINLIIN